MNNNEKHSHTGYASSLPYPEVRVLSPNPYYASILMNDYAGLVSELTAINQYIYHSFMYANEELVKLFKNTAIVEMHHLDMLAELINLLGGNPIYKDMSNNVWNSKYVYYGMDLCDRLKNDLESEYKAIDNYQKDINLIKDTYVQAVLKRIILDEQVHIELFKYAIAQYKCS